MISSYTIDSIGPRNRGVKYRAYKRNLTSQLNILVYNNDERMELFNDLYDCFVTAHKQGYSIHDDRIYVKWAYELPSYGNKWLTFYVSDDALATFHFWHPNLKRGYF